MVQTIGMALTLYLDPFGNLSGNELCGVGRTLRASRTIARGIHGTRDKVWLE